MANKKNMHKLNSKLVAYSLAIVSGIIYVICVMLFAVSPRGTLMIFGNMFHGINMMAIARTTMMPAGNILIGLIEIIILGLVVGWLFAEVYNALIKKVK